MLRSRAELRIDLAASKITKPYYTTLDEISGRVIFAPQSPVLVKDVIIDFLGLSKTWVDPAVPGTPRKRACCQVNNPSLFIVNGQFLKMNDDKDIREPKQASRTNPLELPFTFVVPRELLPTVCKCPTDAQHPQHLHLPPSLGTWANCDDMSADMYPAITARLTCIGQRLNTRSMSKYWQSPKTGLPSSPKLPSLSNSYPYIHGGIDGNRCYLLNPVQLMSVSNHRLR